MEFVSSASEECVGNTINLIILIWLSGSLVSRGLPEGHAVGGGGLISYPLSPCTVRADWPLLANHVAVFSCWADVEHPW